MKMDLRVPDCEDWTKLTQDCVQERHFALRTISLRALLPQTVLVVTTVLHICAYVKVHLVTTTRYSIEFPV
jgi:hypothetical protein